MSIKIALVTASKGTLLGHCLDTQVFARTVHTVITDRECGAEKIGQRHGVRVRRYEGCDNPELSSRIGNYCRENGVDYIISVFSRLFTPELTGPYSNRIFNLHPALLPSFPGLGSYEKALAHGVRFIGETLHAVDEGVDTGPQVMQCVFPADIANPRRLRHTLFVAECKMLIQLTAWLEAGRVGVDGRKVSVEGATFDSPHFSPALEDPEALKFDIPMPAAQ